MRGRGIVEAGLVCGVLSVIGGCGRGTAPAPEERAVRDAPDDVVRECRPQKTGLTREEFNRHADEVNAALETRVERVVELENGIARRYPRDPELARLLARYVAVEAFC